MQNKTGVEQSSKKPVVSLRIDNVAQRRTELVSRMADQAVFRTLTVLGYSPDGDESSIWRTTHQGQPARVEVKMDNSRPVGFLLDTGEELGLADGVGQIAFGRPGMRSFGMVLLAGACGGVSDEDVARLVPKNPKQQPLAERLKQYVLSMGTAGPPASAEEDLETSLLSLPGEANDKQLDAQGLVATAIAAYTKGSGWLIRVGDCLLQLQELTKAQGKAFWEWYSEQRFPFSPRAAAYYMSAARGAAALELASLAKNQGCGRADLLALDRIGRLQLEGTALKTARELLLTGKHLTLEKLDELLDREKAPAGGKRTTKASHEHKAQAFNELDLDNACDLCKQAFGSSAKGRRFIEELEPELEQLVALVRQSDDSELATSTTAVLRLLLGFMHPKQGTADRSAAKQRHGTTSAAAPV